MFKRGDNFRIVKTSSQRVWSPQQTAERVAHLRYADLRDEGYELVIGQ